MYGEGISKTGELSRLQQTEYHQKAVGILYNDEK